MSTTNDGLHLYLGRLSPHCSSSSFLEVVRTCTCNPKVVMVMEVVVTVVAVVVEA